MQPGQKDRLKDLAVVVKDLGPGAEGCLAVRVLKPSIWGKGGFNSQHSKTIIADDQVYVGGSANLTYQAERNFEDIIVCREPEVI